MPGQTVASASSVSDGETAAPPAGHVTTGREHLLRQQQEEERRTLKALRTRLSAVYPAELLRARALVGVGGEEAEQFLREVREDFDGWLTRAANTQTDWNARWSAWPSVYPSVMKALLEAIVRVPRRDAPLVRAILDATDRVMAPGPDRGLEYAARILSGDERYEAEAEHAISILRRDARPPISRPADGVDALLAAYKAAHRFDEGLAADLVREAREVANSVEAEIPGRAAGLASVTGRATTRDVSSTASGDGAGGNPRLTLSTRQMVRLFSYLSRVADERADIDVGESLRYLARVNLAAASEEVTRLEKEEVLNVSSSVLAIAEGAIQGAHLPVDAAWPLVNFSGGVSERVYRAAVEVALQRGEPIEESLAAFAEAVCCRSQLRSRVETVTRFLEWANSLEAVLNF